MTSAKRNWDLLTEKQRQEAIDEIINFFSNERNEEIGVIAAGNLLDMFLQNVGVHLYNKGVTDTSDFIKSRLEEINVDIEVSIKK